MEAAHFGKRVEADISATKFILKAYVTAD